MLSNSPGVWERECTHLLFSCVTLKPIRFKCKSLLYKASGKVSSWKWIVHRGVGLCSVSQVPRSYIQAAYHCLVVFLFSLFFLLQSNSTMWPHCQWQALPYMYLCNICESPLILLPWNWLSCHLFMLCVAQSHVILMFITRKTLWLDKISRHVLSLRLRNARL